MNLWRSKSVFVTGATGLLGSWLVSELVQQGASVTALMRDRTPFSLLHQEGLDHSINAVTGDITDYLLIERTLAEYEVEVVFHLAAQTQVLVANRSPLSTFEANIRGTYMLLEACRRHSLLKAVIVASSDKAYGSPSCVPCDETAPLRGRHPYEVSKSCADLLAQSYSHSFGVPICVTRCGNLFGGGDLNFSRIIPSVIRSVLYNEPPVIRSDGSAVRDYFYVRDAVHAYLLLAEKMLTAGIKAKEYNFSNELQINVIDLTRRILRMMKREDLQPVVLGRGSGEIQVQGLAAARARRELGWSPRFDLDSALQETVAWYTNFLSQHSKWQNGSAEA